MAVAPPDEFLKWGGLVERLLIPAYYRIFSFTSIHAPVDEIFKVCDYMSKNTALAGKITVNIPGRLFTWDNMVINQNPTKPVTMNMRIFGSTTMKRNTVFVRVGWYKAYVFDAVFSRVGGRLAGFAR